MNKNYVPGKQETYNDWQLALVAAVTLNAATWGIIATALAELVAKSAIYTPLYNAIKNKNTRTKQQVYAHDTYKKTYTKFLRGFVQGKLITNELITSDELVAMGLNPHVYVRTERPKITDKPTIAPSNIGGGEVRFRCTTPGLDTKGRHPESNGIELFYALESSSAKVSPVDPKPDTNSGTATPPPAEEQFLQSIFSSRANFIHEFGVNSIGKVLRVYGRWVNTAKKENSGPFGIIASIVIS